MLANHAAGIAARGASLAAEARGVGNQLQRQLFRVENFTGHDVGQRHFGSRDQVQVGFTLAADLEQIFLEFRQLASALQCRRLDQVRGVGFFVTVLADVQVDHELRQGTVQARNRTAQQGKAGAGQLGGGFEIQPAVLLAQGDVVLDREIEGSRRAPAAHFDVAVFVIANRHRFVRQVGDAQQDRIQFRLDRIQFGLAGIQFLRHAIDIRHQRRDVFAALLGLADGFGARVTFGLQLLGAGLDVLAAVLQRIDTRYVQAETTGSKAVRYVLELAT
ncbi:hypothetical protein D3C85_1160840 [compost metagenome]